jgi:predicted MPP superfamily phosphohydrolase
MHKVMTAAGVALIVGVRLAAQLAVAPPQGETPLPVAASSVKFAVIGDSGTGDGQQYDVGRQMATVRERFPFQLVLMLGDNLYGRQQQQDFVLKFERPYASLLQSGVSFYAALGNHDDQNNRFYKGFNMGGERYYAFAVKNVRFFVFDSNLMDQKQVAWIDESMQQAQEPWKVCIFHHPIYSDAGRHGPNVELRVILEPLLVRHRANVVFSGHEHVYERTQPQKGITYFIDGSGGQLRKGDITRSRMTAAAFDQDQTFMVVEIDGDTLFFQAISRMGRIVDSGAIRRPSSS